MRWKNAANDFVKKLKNNGQYRSFIELQKLSGYAPKARTKHGTEVTVWCANDYLNLSQHPDVINAANSACLMYGVGSGGTRNISGSNPHITGLEEDIATFHNRQKAVLFSSAFAANTGSISALGKIMPEVTFVSDSDNHASIIEGMKGQRKAIFKHNCLHSLEKTLQNTDGPVCVCTESVFSMDGTIAPLVQIESLVKKHGALLYVDEVHAVGLYDQEGRGICAKLNVLPDILVGGCGKAFGTQGGYTTGDDELIDSIRSAAPSFIFTTSSSTPVVVATRMSIQIAQKALLQRKQLFVRVSQLRKKLSELGVHSIGDCGSHIVIIDVGDEHICAYKAAMLLAAGEYVQPIFYPTVPSGKARLRITPTHLHTYADIERLSYLIAGLN